MQLNPFNIAAQSTDESTNSSGKTIFDYWKEVMPEFEPRDSQVKTFEWLSNLDPSTKYILLEMPVGGGKSPIGLTYSKWLSNGVGSSFILTPQKILQRQYEESFNSHLLYSMYGKSNFQCNTKDTTCEVGQTIKPQCENCPQKIALQRAMASSNLVLNYTLALLYFMYLPDLKPRKLIVMDECHNLENHLVEFSNTAITEFNCNKIGKVQFRSPKNITDAYKWIRGEYMTALASYITRETNEVKEIYENYRVRSIPITKHDSKKIKDFIAMQRHYDTINENFLEFDIEDVSENFVMINGSKKFNIKELYGKRIFHGSVKPMAEKFLFMSSTILNKSGFCADLGIKEEETAFLSLESEFEKENRMVVYMPQAKMSYGWDKPERKTGRQKMIKGLKDILEMHKDDSGIIHTGSYKISRWIVNELATYSDHKILNHNPSDGVKISRDDIIDEYLESTKHQPTILISPSITEGLDLKYDRGRFTIFAKVPYPFLGDDWIKRRMELSNQWYMRQTLKEMIQGSGRVCRTHDDWGVTYILDESFGFLYNRTKSNMIPKWWNDGMVHTV